MVTCFIFLNKKQTNENSSVSLSSLDSEEQESLRAAERLHNRSSRNSTGGISTHSLNEAELAVSLVASQKQFVEHFQPLPPSLAIPFHYTIHRLPFIYLII